MLRPQYIRDMKHPQSSGFSEQTKRSLGRIISNIACLIMLSAGSLFTIFFFGYFNRMPDGKGDEFIGPGTDFAVGTRYVTMFAIILLAIIVIIETASFILNKNATRNTLHVAIFCLSYIISSHDVLNMLSFIPFFDEVCRDRLGVFATFVFHLPHSVIFFAGVYYIIKFYLNNYDIDISYFKKMGFVLLAAIAFADNILTIFGKQFISALIIMNFALFVYFTFFFISYRKKKVDTVFVLSGLIFFALIGTYIATGSGLMFNNYPIGLDSWGMIVIFALFLMVYANYILRMFKKSYAAQEYENKLKELQSTILMEQINPHFIFNSLVLIKSIYLQDRAKGDRAIDLLSKHIRANVDVKGGKLLIPIEEELKNVQCFVELANMQNNEPLNVFFNIDAYDFLVPALSIEPFIENAIKYSKIQSKEDGFIEVLTEEDQDTYTIRITDNGDGFSKNEQNKKNSHGINNALQRFEFLLHATTKVESEPGQGTTIEIVIPKAGK